MKTHFEKNTDDIVDAKGQPYPDCLIINQPDLKNMPLLFGEGILTILFWGAWFYLWLPVVSMLAWWLGFKFFYRHMVELGGFSGFIKFLNVFFSGIFLLCGALAIWSFYNLKRYGSYHRRNKTMITDMNKLAADFNVSNEKLQKTQKAKRISFSFTEDNTIKEIKLSQANTPQKQNN
jgi:poly-beta-1,6-N-acetyl-D-glucosamine biosynthesis protein PgaD